MRANLATLVDTWRANGSQTAVVRYSGNRSTRTSYAELVGLAERVAGELARRGIVREERIVLWGQNSPEWIAAFFGCVLRGALVVPLDAAGTAEFARRVLEDTAPKLVIGDADLLATLDPNGPNLALENLAKLPAAGELAPVVLIRESPLQILFTSGTTSEPKGIVHTHGNILASVEPIEREMQQYGRYERWFHPLRFLHTLPLSHVFGQFMGLWLPPLLAAEVHFETRLEAERVIRTIHRERITVLAAVPRMLDLLRSHLLLQDKTLAAEIAAAAKLPVKSRIWKFRRIHSLFGWKYWAFVCGGASLPGDLEQFWSTLGFAVVQGYGMTETAALITLNHPFKISRGSIGKALPGREVRIGPEGEISVRGEMVSTATWQQGRVIQREDPWLTTGDLASTDEAGNLRFVGRKSEVIVNPSGLNIHPEDVEAALLRQPEIASCAVVPLALAGGGHEPAAVLVAPGGRAVAEAAVLAANPQLAEFQRVRRWFLWPEADLPRTSTGKVQRRKVAAWVAGQQLVEERDPSGQDSLTALIAAVTGRPATRADDAARLAEDLQLDSLGRVQLQSAIEQRFGTSIDDETFARIETLGQLRAMAMGGAGVSGVVSAEGAETPPQSFIYPHWTWSKPMAAVRFLFAELISRPLVWLLLNPKVVRAAQPLPQKPLLLIANHVTLLDVPLLLYGLPFDLRNRIAVASAGEMLEDWRHARNQGNWFFNLLAPPQYWLTTALFNLFPLPRLAGFRRSFAHMGEAMDRGMSVLVFPEGRRSHNAVLAPFRPGIGLLAQESGASILPVVIRGMETLLEGKRWFHKGAVEIVIGTPVDVNGEVGAEAIARELHAVMERMLAG
jgi:long-chain acyl-CoA synthetase